MNYATSAEKDNHNQMENQAQDHHSWQMGDIILQHVCL